MQNPARYTFAVSRLTLYAKQRRMRTRAEIEVGNVLNSFGFALDRFSEQQNTLALRTKDVMQTINLE